MDNNSIKCPGCGAPIFIRNDADHVACEYCGTIVSASEAAMYKHKKDAQLNLELERINKSIRTYTVLLSFLLAVATIGFGVGFLYKPPVIVIGLLTSLIAGYVIVARHEAAEKREKIEKQKLL